MSERFVDCAVRVTGKSNVFEEPYWQSHDCYVSFEISKEGVEHHHAFIDQASIGALRAWFKRRFPGEGNARHSVELVKDPMDYLSYMSKDGVIVRNDLCFDTEVLRQIHQNKKQIKNEFKKEAKERSIKFIELLYNTVTKGIPEGGHVSIARITIDCMRLCREQGRMPPNDYLLMQYCEHIWNVHGNRQWLEDKIHRVTEKLSPRQMIYNGEEQPDGRFVFSEIPRFNDFT